MKTPCTHEEPLPEGSAALSDASCESQTARSGGDSINVVNFGCRLNTYEGEVIRQRATEAGLENAIIFNSCAVTAEAERQVRQAIRRARKEHPDAKIIVTGCSAQINPQQYAQMEGVSLVLGNQEKLEGASYAPSFPRRRESSLTRGSEDKNSTAADAALLDSRLRGNDNTFIAPDEEKILVNDIMSVKETASHLVSSFDGRARAFVQVQNGCDHRCTFCIIPYGRGNSRSVPMGDIVREVRALVESGFNEIVLTGVDISDYGKDLPGSPTLGQMMRRLLALVPELKRLRLSSIDAVEVDDDLYRLIAEEARLMPHIHISLQAGDDMVLKRMKRRHLRQDALDFCERVRKLRPGVVFGADIIAGFPTETDEMFANTLALVDEAALTYLHVFPYSARTGTPAAKMPQVPKDIRKLRAAQLREAGDRQLARFLASKVSGTAQVVVEKDSNARTEHFALLRLDRELPPGTLAHARVTRADNHTLYGTLLP